MNVLTLKGAQQREADLAAEGRALFAKAEKEGRDLTAEELERDDQIAAELDQVRATRARLERQQERERNLPRMADPNQAATEAAESATAATAVAAKKIVNPFASLGDQLQAVARAAMGRGYDSRLDMMAAAAGASEAVPSDGGFLVVPDYSMEIFRRVYEMGQISSRVRRVPISANSNALKTFAVDETSRANGSRWGGVASYWTPEAGAMTASRPKLRMLSLELHKMTALFYATDELLADAAALSSIMQQALPEEINFRVEDAIVHGTGAGQPAGILNSAAKVAVAKETGQAAATVVFQNIVNMYSRMWAPSRANAVWFINQDIEPQLFSMSLAVGTGGVPVYMPANGVAGSPFATLMGRPVIPVEYCETVGTEGDIIFADMSQYLMIDKGGIESASSMHVQFLTNEMTFRFVYRTDGQSVWNAPLTPFKGSATKSPFITLAVRS